MISMRARSGASRCSIRSKLVIDNYPEGASEDCFAPNHPQRPEWGKRALPLTRELWIERDDYTDSPPKGYFRLTPGAEVRLRYGYIVRCTGAETDAAGNVTVVHCTYDPDTRSGTPGADARKVKGNIHWLSAEHAVPAEVRVYDRLFGVPFPGARNPWAARGEPRRPKRRRRRGTLWLPATRTMRGDAVERNYLDDLNPDSKRILRAYVEPALAGVPRRNASSSSGTVILSPTSKIMRRASRCSTAR